jgi:aquaporin Z
MNTRIALAEALGTAVLVIGGVGSAVLAGKAIGALGVALAFGLSLLAMAYAIGHVSGCHINPAVTIGLVVAGREKLADAPAYIVGQIVGAIAGSAALWAIASGRDGFDLSPETFGTNQYGHDLGFYALGAVIVSEVVLTALLVIVVLSCTRRAAIAGFAGIPIGLTLTLIHLVSIPVDNTSVNPARSLGPALFARGDALTQLWVFIVFPLVGAALGALAYKALVPEEAEATFVT